MFHCNGWCTPWSLTAIAGTHVCLREVRGEAIWQQLREHGVTHLNAAPTVVSSILNAPEAGPLTRPVLITTAGAPPSPTTIAQMERMGFQVVHVYGLTETYGPISYCQSQPQWAGLSSGERSVLQARQGVSMIQAEGLRVVDEQMADVPADGSTMGEIVMRGNNVMAGYYADPAATAHAFRGGWFHSGDLGVMHPDGYIELRDRSKDIVISGGENISTIEVEQALMSHPAVLDVAVIGIPDDKWGERPKAFAGAPGRPQRNPGRADRVRPHQDRPLQGPSRGRHRSRAAEDINGQDPEVRAPRTRVGRTHPPRTRLAFRTCHAGASPHDAAGMVIAMPEQLAGRLNIASFRP
jgi:fatty-acyl-CoA synthase